MIKGSRNPVLIEMPAGTPFIDIEREFEAPVEAVYRAHRDPDLVRQWMGPNGYEMRIGTWDLRTGGGFHYSHIGHQGEKYSFRGVFHTARENELIVQTFEFEGFPDIVSIESLNFEDLGGGRTRLKARSVYPSLEARDGMASSGMEAGVSQGYARLDALLANRATTA